MQLKKGIVNTRNRTCQTRRQVILVLLTTVTKDNRYGTIKKQLEKGSYQIMR